MILLHLRDKSIKVLGPRISNMLPKEREGERERERERERDLKNTVADRNSITILYINAVKAIK